MMNLLLEYAYLRSVDVNHENVCELLTTADYLNIVGVIDLCCDYLRDNLAPENCIGVMRFARQYFYKKLENDAYRFIVGHFVEVRLILDNNSLLYIVYVLHNPSQSNLSFSLIYIRYRR